MLGNTRLRRLYLFSLVFNETETIQVLAKGIGQSKLNSVLLNNVTVTTRRIWQTMYHSLQSSQTIQELTIETGPPIGGIIALGDALPFMQSLRHLDLTLSDCKVPAALALARGISQSKLQRLKIIDWSSGSPVEVARQVRQMLYIGLKHSPTIQQLYLAPVPMDGLAW